MLSNREKIIIQELIQANPNFVSTNHLAEKCNKSTRTIQSDLNKIKNILKDNGADLELSHKEGYRLKIVHLDMYQSFCRKYVNVPMNSIESQKDRTLYILSRILECAGYIKSDDLADELFVSKSTINQNVKELKGILIKYGLKLEHKPYYGLKIIGDEINKRKCIINEIMAVQNFVTKDHDKIFDIINDITSNCFFKMQYKIDDVAIMNLLMHIYINVKRMKKKQYIKFDKNESFFSVFSHEIQMAKDIYTELSKILDFEVIEDEINSLAVNIKGKRNYDSEDVITEEMNVIISEMLSYINEKSNIDLSYDVELRVALALHFLPLNIRLANNMQLKNPMLSDIKQKFTFAYELATLSGVFIHDKFGYILNENELGYLAVHYNLSLEKQACYSKPKRILILCSSRTSDSLLLKFTLKKWFKEMILGIDVLNLYEVNADKLKKYDVVFTTITGDCRLPIDAIKINYFLDEKDYLSIQKALNMDGEEKQLLNYFEENLFITDIKADTKDKIIEIMTSLAIRYKKVGSNLYDSVIQREMYGYTSFGHLVAIPHPNDLISDETFVVTAILNHPISWGSQQVQLVFLVCVEKENKTELKNLFGVMSKLLADLNMIQDIIQKKDFKYLIKCLKEKIYK